VRCFPAGLRIGARAYGYGFLSASLFLLTQIMNPKSNPLPTKMDIARRAEHEQMASLVHG